MKEMLYLTTHSTHFIYGYMASGTRVGCMSSPSHGAQYSAHLINDRSEIDLCQ